MNILKIACGFALIGLGGCTATIPSDAEIKEANQFLAQNAWGGANAGARRTSSNTSSSKKIVVRNESHEAIAGVPLQVGVRWAIRDDCSTRTFNVRVIQQPRFGEAYVRPVNFTVPTTALNRGQEATMRRCAGTPTIGQAIFYRAPEGKGNYIDNFAIETSTGLRFNYRIRVIKPVG
ncbi:hypothetical protein [Hoeflea prorocentri]|uniref:Lipoprotein n=1 Tax=Hoeflea prorocentri TaxID=1922333 RepID=A0A9X3UF44_9HYPH|nr:hypothetical protein [Hoeflea prorocentri]MCY6380208.1 hypothetical protein [Hoeflea prorocentri]MDA5398008.1 hypothetical protein [Hoeflea prorocentri]